MKAIVVHGARHEEFHNYSNIYERIKVRGCVLFNYDIIFESAIRALIG